MNRCSMFETGSKTLLVSRFQVYTDCARMCVCVCVCVLVVVAHNRAIAQTLIGMIGM